MLITRLEDATCLPRWQKVAASGDARTFTPCVTCTSCYYWRVADNMQYYAKNICVTVVHVVALLTTNQLFFPVEIFLLPSTHCPKHLGAVFLNIQQTWPHYSILMLEYMHESSLPAQDVTLQCVLFQIHSGFDISCSDCSHFDTRN